MEKFYYALIVVGAICLVASIFGLGVVFGRTHI